MVAHHRIYILIKKYIFLALLDKERKFDKERNFDVRVHRGFFIFIVKIL